MFWLLDVGSELISNGVSNCLSDGAVSRVMNLKNPVGSELQGSLVGCLYDSDVEPLCCYCCCWGHRLEMRLVRSAAPYYMVVCL